MDGISTDIVTQSVAALNQVMKNAQEQYIELAEDMVALTVSMTVGQESGKGAQLDIIA